MKPAPIQYESGVLRIIDQAQLPAKVNVVELHSWQDVADAIRGMNVRGAPAIGIAGAYGMALAARELADRPVAEIMRGLETAAAILALTRPTAVNLPWAVHRTLREAQAAAAAGASATQLVAVVERSALAIHDEDVQTCRRIGDAGAALLKPGCAVLTHCNSGDLATGGYGTALGIIRSAWRDGKLRHVYAMETRPMLQGARLTALELLSDGIPFTLIADGMVGLFMRRKQIDAVLVGADRVARNGDIANKVGTYVLGVLAKAHGIPFYVAVPRSSFDPELANGDAIVIEERNPAEVTQIQGVLIAPEGTPAANPAFDITPAEYISRIITEFGIFDPPYAQSLGPALDANTKASAAS